MGKVKETLQDDLEIASVAEKGETDSSKTRAPKRRSLLILVLTLVCLFIIIGVSWAILASRSDSPNPTNSPTSAPSLPPSYITISFDTERFPGTSGIYFPSLDLIGHRSVWYRQGDDGSDSMMIYYCSISDKWVLTSSYYRQSLIDSNGGECGGYEFTISGSGSSNGWWTYDWESDVTISFPLPNSVTITFISEYSGGSSGKYFTSNDDIGAKPVWYRDGDTGDDSMMIFYCASGDSWVLTSAYYRQGLINSNGGGCAGIERTYSGGTVFDSWWAREWTTETKISFDNTDFLDISIDEIFDILEDPSLYSPDVLGRAEFFITRMNDLVPETDDAILQELSEAILKACESIFFPVSDSFEKTLLRHESKVMKDLTPFEVTAHPSAENTYGSIPATAIRLSKIVDMDTGVGRWHPTGLYAAPGDLVTIEVPDDLVGKGFKIRINAHIDVISSKETWERFPEVHRQFEIASRILQVASPFGGPIFIDLGGYDGFSSTPNLGIAQIKISNAIEHPYFVLGVHSDDDWEISKDKPGPSSVFVCDNLILVQKASDSRVLTNPSDLMTWWKKVVTLQDDLAGRLNQRTSPELINVDLQIEYGAAHAGYPIQAYDKYWVNLADYDFLIEEGSWGDFHELGHNLQRQWWTFSGDVEVTVNIFSAYCMRMLTPGSSSEWSWTIDPVEVMKKSIEAVGTGKDYSNISSLALRLAFWIQLIDGFGIETMSAVFRGYEEDYGGDPYLGPSSDLERKSEWLERFSLVTGHDLTQFMVSTWRLEASGLGITSLPTWMPALGGVRGSFETSKNTPFSFNLADEALSLDGIASILIVEQGTAGFVQESSDGLFVYTPVSGYTGSDAFTYAVVSSSGHQFKTTIDIKITLI